MDFVYQNIDQREYVVLFYFILASRLLLHMMFFTRRSTYYCCRNRPPQLKTSGTSLITFSPIVYFVPRMSLTSFSFRMPCRMLMEDIIGRYYIVACIYCHCLSLIKNFILLNFCCHLSRTADQLMTLTTTFSPLILLFLNRSKPVSTLSLNEPWARSLIRFAFNRPPSKSLGRAIGMMVSCAYFSCTVGE